MADFNVRNLEMGGAVGNPIDKHGSPFGLTEEFAEVYRLHSLLPEALQARRMGDGDDGGNPAPEKRARPAPQSLVDEFGMANLSLFVR